MKNNTNTTSEPHKDITGVQKKPNQLSKEEGGVASVPRPLFSDDEHTR
jgi:hypothetical protein